MATVTHRVVKGDTLSEIAVKYNTTVGELVMLNPVITNPDYIVVGQVIIVSGDPATSTKNTTYKAVIDVFGLQSNTDRTMYATWTWDKEDTENYQVKWYYDTGDDVWFIGTDSTVKEKQSVYTAPNSALRVKFIVKPVAKSDNRNNTSTSKWTAEWSTAKTYSFSNNPPSTPPVPTVVIDKYKLTATLTNIDVNATTIQFQIVKDNASVFNSGNANIKTGYVSYSCNIKTGSEYKVRCRAVRGGVYSAWSAYSNNYSTIPDVPSSIDTCKANSETSIYLAWSSVKTATSYDIEYAIKKTYFDGTDMTQQVTGVETNHYEKSGLESGQEYFFRVRAVNSVGKSGWSGIVSVVLGKKPSAPTTWSSSTTVITGEELNLYWVHNAEDGSSQTFAELQMLIDGTKETHTIENTRNEEEKDKTSVYPLDTSEYTEGTNIQWRVRTAGITKTYGDWSIQRSIDIYAPPTLELGVIDAAGDDIETLTSYPFYISALAGPNTQKPIGYHVSIISKEIYETIDNVGNSKIVNKDEAVYSKYFDVSDPLMLELSANHVDLENNVGYTVKVIASMNSGLTVTSTHDFVVAWTDFKYEPNAEIGIDRDTISVYIRPFCEDENGVAIEDISLSVYRREFDGSFTELATGIDNLSNTFIVDPHPSLDLARYRVVAITKSTGSVSYCDIPGYPVGEKCIIIQWDEEWTNFDSVTSDELAEPVWAGSLLKLPYNIDISNNHKQDVALIKYIGREYPVGYYGTQLGETATWSVAIDKNDKETLYALRRLAKWMGNVYVREPSGSGYHANISVSFNQKHGEVTIPVSLDITRVEGGI